MTTWELLPVELKEKIFRLPRKNLHDDYYLFDLHDPAWYIMQGYYVVDVRVTEIDFVLNHPDHPNTVWAHVYPEGVKLLTNVSSDSWDFQALPADVLQDCVMCNQGAWVDLPIGHALYYNDDLFVDLSKAMQWARPHRPRKRQRKSTLNHFIDGGMRFIASTHKKPVAQMNFPKYRRYPERKMYWRKK